MYEIIHNTMNKKYRVKFVILILFTNILKGDAVYEYYKNFGMFRLISISNIPTSGIIYLFCYSHEQQCFSSIILISKEYGYNLLHIYFHANIIEKQQYYDLISVIKCKLITCNNYIISSFFISNRWINVFNNFNTSFVKYGKLISSLVKYVIFNHDIPFLHSDPMKCIYSD